MNSVRTVAIIPARGGSKAIPRKNIIDFCGHPLLAWTIAAARGAAGIDAVYVSTDDTEIARVAGDYGAFVIERPQDISGDTASSESAVLHALDVLAAMSAGEPDRVVFLQATSPLRESAEIDEALARFDADGLDSLFAASEPEDWCVWFRNADGLRSLNYDYRNRGRRQDADGKTSFLIETGSFYITKSAAFRGDRNRLAGRIGYHLVPAWKSHEIDSMDSFELCELLMKHFRLSAKPPEVVRGR